MLYFARGSLYTIKYTNFKACGLMSSGKSTLPLPRLRCQIFTSRQKVLSFSLPVSSPVQRQPPFWLLMSIFEIQTNGIILYVFLCVFHLNQCFLHLSVLLWASLVCCFIADSFLLCEHTIVCLSILLLMNIWVISSLWLLWMKFLWKFLCKSFCEHMYSFLLGIKLEGKLQDRREAVCLISTAKRVSH